MVIWTFRTDGRTYRSAMWTNEEIQTFAAKIQKIVQKLSRRTLPQSDLSILQKMLSKVFEKDISTEK